MKNVVMETKNMTMQWCTICESLNLSVHVKERHGYGGYLGWFAGQFPSQSDSAPHQPYAQTQRRRSRH
jgi:hypothetical protein